MGCFTVEDLNGMLWIIAAALVILDDSRRTRMILSDTAPPVVLAELARLAQNDEHLGTLLRALEEALSRAGASDSLDEFRELLRIEADDLAGREFDSPPAVAQRFLLLPDHPEKIRQDRFDVA